MTDGTAAAEIIRLARRRHGQLRRAGITRCSSMTTYRGRSHSSGERALVGIDEAAVMLGEDRSTLYRSIKHGDFPLPVVTINGRMRVPRKAIETLITGH